MYKVYVGIYFSFWLTSSTNFHRIFFKGFMLHGIPPFPFHLVKVLKFFFGTRGTENDESRLPRFVTFLQEHKIGELSWQCAFLSRRKFCRLFFMYLDPGNTYIALIHNPHLSGIYRKARNLYTNLQFIQLTVPINDYNIWNDESKYWQVFNIATNFNFSYVIPLQ